MKLLGLLLPVLFVACYLEDTQPCPDSSTDATARNNDNTPGGLCCQITNNFVDDPFWNSGFYTCVLQDAPRDPFNPPWICGTTYEGTCGDDGPPCLTCYEPTCVVGMRCRGVNGTGTVIPCK